MPSRLDRLQEYLLNEKYDKAITEYAELLDKNYPKSILEYYSSKYPFLLVDKKNTTRIYTADKINNQGQGKINRTPLVSIIIVSYNSKADLSDCLDAVISQSYTNWELIIIDNGSDGSGEFTRKKIPSAKIISCDNVGFAEANNIGLDNSNGELTLLLNPDAKLSQECLKDMVFAGRQDSNVAAVVPKIYFYKQFAKLRIYNKKIKYSLNYEHLASQLEYQKIFVLHGSLKNNLLVPNKNGEILLDIAINPGCNILSFSVTHEQIRKLSHEKLEINFVGSSYGTQFCPLRTSHLNSLVHVNIDKNVHSSTRFLINNAGSDFRDNGTPYDIGFGQEDHGQYNSKKYVKALCGCCVLLRRDLFVKRKIFISEFFAYFEDTELSNWINKNNYKILYVNTLVYHKHSTATQESSPTWNALVSRSRNLYEYIKNYSETNKADKCKSFNASTDYNGIPASLKFKLTQLDKSIKNKPIRDLVFDSRIVIGIYNSYWSSMGGGEKHALDFAVKFNQCNNTKIYLISETDFSVSQLAEYFDLDLSGCKKIVTGEVTKALTKRFDIFINSTYQSNLVSESANSFYIVSFPHKNINKKLVASYTFLHNSQFTATWAKKYWGDHQSNIILPIQQFSAQKDENMEITSNKEKICLSVGRFNYMGHCKNQHLIIKAFQQAVEPFDSDKKWKLIVVGSMDESSNSSVEHYHDCLRMAGDNVEVIPNISREELSNLYRKASIYIHATGTNMNNNEQPHLCEHFGITVFESLINGCYPILHNSGGPKQQVRDLSHSALYNNEYELMANIHSTIDLFECPNFNHKKISMEIIKYSFDILKKNSLEFNKLVSDTVQ